MPKPAFRATEEDRKHVERAAHVGLRDEDIAVIIGIGESTLKKHFAQELKHGRACAKERLGTCAMQMAMSGDSPAMTIFMCKVRLGMKDNAQEQPSAEVADVVLERGPEPKRLALVKTEAA